MRWSTVFNGYWLAGRRLAAAGVLAVCVAVGVAACAARHGEAGAQVAARLLTAGAPTGDELGYFVLDIDESELRNLESEAGAEDRALLADPAAAASAFGSALGMPASTRYELVERSERPEDGPGAYLATFRASNSGGVVVLRLISQPGADGHPTFWVINDVERQPPRRKPRAAGGASH